MVVGDFDCSGEDIERDWVERTGCWSSVTRVLLTHEQVRAYGLPATEASATVARGPGKHLICSAFNAACSNPPTPSRTPATGG